MTLVVACSGAPDAEHQVATSKGAPTPGQALFHVVRALGIRHRLKGRMVAKYEGSVAPEEIRGLLELRHR